MGYSIQIKHRYKIPESKIMNAIDEINRKIITFGVHKEDNSKHAIRDKVQNGTLHKMLYNNGQPIPPIDNAELLRKAETGREEIFTYGREAHLTQIPPRPVLQPMVQTALWLHGDLIKNAVQKQFEFKNIYTFNQELNKFKLKLNRTGVYDFVRNRGMGYWEGGEHNSPYVQAVKYFDRLDESEISKITYQKSFGIKKIASWDTTRIYHQGDTPLMDSLDLLNSIKSKIEDR